MVAVSIITLKYLFILKAVSLLNIFFVAMEISFAHCVADLSCYACILACVAYIPFALCSSPLAIQTPGSLRSAKLCDLYFSSNFGCRSTQITIRLDDKCNNVTFRNHRLHQTVIGVAQSPSFYYLY